MITLDAARALLLDGVHALDIEPVALADAMGRTLAEPVVASADQPALPMSAMDGYAVSSGDGVSGKTLRVVGEAYAGTPFARPIVAGEAVRIATGGVVPRGTGRIVIQEVARRENDLLWIDGPLSDATFIRPAGGDFRAGEVLIEAGAALTAARLALAAAAGKAELGVRRRPRIAVFASGDELRQPGEALAPGEVVDSASVALASLIRGWGGTVERHAILPDDQARSAAMIAPSASDVALFVGGASVGDRDVVRAAVMKLGATIAFDRIAVQPGKPCWHARFPDGRLALGLPGNPASAFVCAHLLLEPLISALLGRASHCALKPARLAVDLASSGERETWWRARVAIDATGQRLVTPDPRRDSSLQRPLAEANALLRQPAGMALAAGDTVAILDLA